MDLLTEYSEYCNIADTAIGTLSTSMAEAKKRDVCMYVCGMWLVTNLRDLHDWNRACGYHCASLLPPPLRGCKGIQFVPQVITGSHDHVPCPTAQSVISGTHLPSSSSYCFRKQACFDTAFGPL